MGLLKKFLTHIGLVKKKSDPIKFEDFKDLTINPQFIPGFKPGDLHTLPVASTYDRTFNESNIVMAFGHYNKNTSEVDPVHIIKNRYSVAGQHVDPQFLIETFAEAIVKSRPHPTNINFFEDVMITEIEIAINKILHTYDRRHV